MAPEVRFNSAAAAVKLEVRAAASNARSHVNVGRPTTGRICDKGASRKNFVAKGIKILGCMPSNDQFIVAKRPFRVKKLGLN
jgi:hypothetical protein